MTKKDSSKIICGIIMPISAIDGCSESHWTDVLNILQESVEAAGYVPNLVSNADESGIIQKRIIQNLYENPIVICDVSAKNPNVMFELGMRLAFDRPTIIIKDNLTGYSFDTSPIEHLEYPRDLRFNKIVDFKEQLIQKLTNTYTASTADKEYSTFLKNFGEFKVPKLETKEVTGIEFLIDEINNLKKIILSLDKDKITSSYERDAVPRHLQSYYQDRGLLEPLLSGSIIILFKYDIEPSSIEINEIDQFLKDEKSIISHRFMKDRVFVKAGNDLDARKFSDEVHKKFSHFVRKIRIGSR